eukprot:1175058-Amphidinium_carterae.2
MSSLDPKSYLVIHDSHLDRRTLLTLREVEHIYELQIAARSGALGCLVQHLFHTFHVRGVARGLGTVCEVNDHDRRAGAGIAGDVRADGFVNHREGGGSHLMQESVKQSKGAVSGFLRQKGDGLNMLNLGNGAAV